jgi:GntR family transcriptional repressor for pyruvate dehydrogenase complex
MSKPMQKVRRARLSDQAAAEIKRLIADGTYPPGGRLPTEAELALRLGVTRLTVREALSQLEAQGLTRTRHGSGTHVVDLDSSATFHVLAELLGAGRRLSPAECVSLMELRTVVVGGFAEAVAERITDEHVVALEAIVAEARAAHGRPARLAEIDYRFNEVLARGSGNSFYVLLMRSVKEVHQELGAVIFGQLREHEVITSTYAAIVDALKERKLAKLRRSIGAYLEGGAEVLRQSARRPRPSRTSGEPT